jgi:hypothetical protein
VRSATSRSQLQEFAIDSGSSPQGIGRGHPRSQSADFGVDLRTALRGAAGELDPVVAVASPLPSQHGGWSHDDEGPPPTSVTARRRRVDPVSGPSAGSPSACTRRADGKGEVFEVELAMAAEEEREDAQQVKQRGDHGTGLSPDQSREINS